MIYQYSPDFVVPVNEDASHYAMWPIIPLSCMALWLRVTRQELADQDAISALTDKNPGCRKSHLRLEPARIVVGGQVGSESKDHP